MTNLRQLPQAADFLLALINSIVIFNRGKNNNNNNNNERKKIRRIQGGIENWL